MWYEGSIVDGTMLISFNETYKGNIKKVCAIVITDRKWKSVPKYD